MTETDHWNGWIETRSREQIRAMQDEKVARQVRWVARHSAYWSDLLDSSGVDPTTVTGVDALATVPFGRKHDFRAAQQDDPPYGGLLCRSLDELKVDGGFVWETSGTTGEPLRFFCSQAEFEQVDVEATCRILWTAGIRSGDVLAMFWPLTLWAVGHGIVSAARKMGITVLPLGPSYSTEFRVEKCVEFEPDVIMTTPTYALRLASSAADHGYDPNDVGVERVIVSGEPLPDATRSEIDDRWGVSGSVYDYYGFSEAFNCRSIECEYHDGIHVLEDLYLCQVIDPEGSEPVEPGETGELVVTALEQRDIASGFHFRTGDLARYTDDPCECGRTTRRIEIVSRKDDMKTIKGVNVFPGAVESVVRESGDLADEFRLVVEEDGELDSLRVLVEPRPDLSGSKLDSVRAEVEARLEAAFGGLSVPVDFAEPDDLERFSFKADRWIDNR